MREKRDKKRVKKKGVVVVSHDLLRINTTRKKIDRTNTHTNAVGLYIKREGERNALFCLCVCVCCVVIYLWATALLFSSVCDIYLSEASSSTTTRELLDGGVCLILGGRERENVVVPSIGEEGALAIGTACELC